MRTKRMIASALLALAIVAPSTDMTKAVYSPVLSAQAASCVYWTESGKCWHTTKSCSSLKKSKDIKSGTKDEAKAAGKKKACSKCSS